MALCQTQAAKGLRGEAPTDGLLLAASEAHSVWHIAMAPPPTVCSDVIDYIVCGIQFFFFLAALKVTRQFFDPNCKMQNTRA
jgi:hypothetical protein